MDFHYNLFLQTLLSGSGALAPGVLPCASTRLKFLRLHGDLEQEVSLSSWVGPGFPRDPAGPGKNVAKVGDPPEAKAGDADGARGEPIVPVCFAPGAGLFHPRELAGPTWPDYTPTSC